MTKKLWVICDTKNIDEARLLKSIAVKQGWREYTREETYAGTVAVPQDKSYDMAYIGFSNIETNSDRFIKVNVDQFLDVVLKDIWPEAPPEPVQCGKIAGHNVEFIPNEYIKVGCTRIEDSEVRSLYKAYTATDELKKSTKTKEVKLASVGYGVEFKLNNYKYIKVNPHNNETVTFRKDIPVLMDKGIIGWLSKDADYTVEIES